MKDNEAAIWGNDRKETDRHPDFKGQATVNGVEYWVAAWKRGPDANPKAPALKLSFTAKEEQAQSYSAKSAQEEGEALDSDIPF